MRVIMLFVFVSALVVTPVYLFSNYVVPELTSLKTTYDSVNGATAKVIDAIKPLSH